ncbi:MAG: hypothetical protein ACD_21C00173G0003, partial [uncultured bacterium]
VKVAMCQPQAPQERNKISVEQKKQSPPNRRMVHTDARIKQLYTIRTIKLYPQLF